MMMMTTTTTTTMMMMMMIRPLDALYLLLGRQATKKQTRNITIHQPDPALLMTYSRCSIGASPPADVQYELPSSLELESSVASLMGVMVSSWMRKLPAPCFDIVSFTCYVRTRAEVGVAGVKARVLSPVMGEREAFGGQEGEWPCELIVCFHWPGLVSLANEQWTTRDSIHCDKSYGLA